MSDAVETVDRALAKKVASREYALAEEPSAAGCLGRVMRACGWSANEAVGVLERDGECVPFEALWLIDDADPDVRGQLADMFGEREVRVATEAIEWLRKLQSDLSQGGA